jgi:hypothetical protein
MTTSSSRTTILNNLWIKGKFCDQPSLVKVVLTLEYSRKKPKKETSTRARRDAVEPKLAQEKKRSPPKKRVGNPYPPPIAYPAGPSTKPELGQPPKKRRLAPKPPNAIDNACIPPVIASVGPSSIWPANGTSTAPKLHGPSQSALFPNKEDDSNSWLGIRCVRLGEDELPEKKNRDTLVRVFPSVHRPQKVKKAEKKWTKAYKQREAAISSAKGKGLDLRVPPEPVGGGWDMKNGRTLEQKIKVPG